MDVKYAAYMFLFRGTLPAVVAGLLAGSRKAMEIGTRQICAAWPVEEPRYVIKPERRNFKP
jgi:hypothetical protein